MEQSHSGDWHLEKLLDEQHNAKIHKDDHEIQGVIMTAEFKHIMLMVEDIPATVKFYSEGLGLTVKMASPGWAELDAGGTTIVYRSEYGALGD